LKKPLNPLLSKKIEISFDGSKLQSPASVKRKIPSKRELKIELRKKTASEVIGKLEKKCSVFGVTKGQFSLIELIAAVLDQTGPADIFVSTWTAAGTDLTDAAEFLKDGKIKSIRFIVDHTFQRRKPAFAAKIRELFGLESVRVTKNHAKFCMIRNDEWDIVIRTSMNLNFNPRFENFEIDDDPALANFLQSFVNEIFGKIDKNHMAAKTKITEGLFKEL